MRASLDGSLAWIIVDVVGRLHVPGEGMRRFVREAYFSYTSNRKTKAPTFVGGRFRLGVGHSPNGIESESRLGIGRTQVFARVRTQQPSIKDQMATVEERAWERENGCSNCNEPLEWNWIQSSANAAAAHDSRCLYFSFVWSATWRWRVEPERLMYLQPNSNWCGDNITDWRPLDSQCVGVFTRSDYGHQFRFRRIGSFFFSRPSRYYSNEETKQTDP